MRTFNSFNKAFDWVGKIVEETKEQATEEIAKQVYEDSEEFTYIDTGDMYRSGRDSDFKGGYVLIKAPQVRWLYYTAWITPRGNKSAIPQWFERTKTENIGNYIKIYSTLLKKNKE